MAQHQVGIYSIELWRGDRPQIPAQNVLTRTRAGIDGVSQQLIGEWHRPIACQLESWHADYATAINTYRDYETLVGGDLVKVIYETIDWAAAYETQFSVDSVRLVEARAALNMMALGVYQAFGARLVTEWTMTPQHVEPPPP